MGPCSSTASSEARVAAPSVRSQLTSVASPPPARILPTSASATATPRCECTYTWCPSRASRRHTAPPIAPLPPVTRARRPVALVARGSLMRGFRWRAARSWRRTRCCTPRRVGRADAADCRRCDALRCGSGCARRPTTAPRRAGTCGPCAQCAARSTAGLEAWALLHGEALTVEVVEDDAADGAPRQLRQQRETAGGRDRGAQALECGVRHAIRGSTPERGHDARERRRTRLRREHQRYAE